MEFISGFQWAMPMAFADSLGKARFVEGDIFYDDSVAYTADWRTAAPAIKHTIQVRAPTRSSDTIDQSVRDVFTRNWDSEVRIELFSHLKKVETAQIWTTQGRLYTTLWKGHLDVLFTERTPSPSQPVTAHQTSKDIEQLIRVAQIQAPGQTTFVMVRDICNSISRDKFQKISTKLRPHMSQPPIVITPHDGKLSNWELIAPTVNIAVFPTTGIDRSQLEELVKQAVYVPGKDAKKSMFRLNSHGLIV